MRLEFWHISISFHWSRLHLSATIYSYKLKTHRIFRLYAHKVNCFLAVNVEVITIRNPNNWHEIPDNPSSRFDYSLNLYGGMFTWVISTDIAHVLGHGMTLLAMIIRISPDAVEEMMRDRLIMHPLYSWINLISAPFTQWHINKTEMTWQVSIIPNCSPDNELWFCQVVKEILTEYNRIEWFALRVTISSHWRESATNVISRSPEHYCKSEKEAENNPSRSRCSTDFFFSTCHNGF